ncbi:MAG: hypothetical protein WBL40_07985 [Terrimicrobiaceae bacterium]
MPTKMFRDASSPTCSEIQNHFGFASPATVSAHLDLLEKKGAIQRERRKARNIILPGRKTGLIDIPIFGTIPAGHPSDQQQESGFPSRRRGTTWRVVRRETKLALMRGEFRVELHCPVVKALPGILNDGQA